ncbi:MAG: 50S ribosomal protein L13 [Dehalococcoidia bacterium]|jgi:large subunit ribosomal protein L13
MKTYSVKSGDIERQWHVFDASGKTLGRLATEVAMVLLGKDKPTFSRHVNVGDYVIVINAAKIKVTGNKEQQKIYYRHSNYPGGLRSVRYVDMFKENPEKVVTLAVKGMIPRSRLGRQIMGRLKVYAGDEHPHQAQVGKSEKGE